MVVGNNALFRSTQLDTQRPFSPKAPYDPPFAEISELQPWLKRFLFLFPAFPEPKYHSFPAHAHLPTLETLESRHIHIAGSILLR